MTDSGPPKLDQIPQSSGFNVPTMSSMNSESVQDTQQGLYSSQVQLHLSRLAVECALIPLWQYSRAARVTPAQPINISSRCSICCRHDPESSCYTEFERYTGKWCRCGPCQGPACKDNLRILSSCRLSHHSRAVYGNWPAVDS